VRRNQRAVDGLVEELQELASLVTSLPAGTRPA